MCKVAVVEASGSTNTDCLSLLKSDVLDVPFALLAIEQTAGRGRLGRACKATPGSMPAWQWALLSPETYDGFKVEGTYNAQKATDAVNAFIGNELKLTGDSTGRVENDERDYNFQSQEELKNTFYKTNKKKTTQEEEGISTVLLIVIIAAAVVVVGGGVAVAIILISKKKKKAAALAAQAATEEAAAPAEEAQAPAAEEEKKDE